MRIAIALAALLCAATSHALAQNPTLQYNDIVSEARRYERLESSERVVSNKILGKKVKLDLKKFGNGSPDFFVRRADMIGFICSKKEQGFKGGTVIATVKQHEEGADGSHFYTVDNCSTK